MQIKQVVKNVGWIRRKALCWVWCRSLPLHIYVKFIIALFSEVDFLEVDNVSVSLERQLARFLLIVCCNFEHTHFKVYHR